MRVSWTCEEEPYSRETQISRIVNPRASPRRPCPVARPLPNPVRLCSQPILRALWWRHRREDLAVIRWNLHREEAAAPTAHDVEGDAHTPSERLGASVGCFLGHAAPRFAQWHVALPTRFCAGGSLRPERHRDFP